MQSRNFNESKDNTQCKMNKINLWTVNVNVNVNRKFCITISIFNKLSLYNREPDALDELQSTVQRGTKLRQNVEKFARLPVRLVPEVAILSIVKLTNPENIVLGQLVTN